MSENTKLPKGWNEARVRRVLEYYETQTDEEAAAEHELTDGQRRELQESIAQADRGETIDARSSSEVSRLIAVYRRR